MCSYKCFSGLSIQLYDDVKFSFPENLVKSKNESVKPERGNVSESINIVRRSGMKNCGQVYLVCTYGMSGHYVTTKAIVEGNLSRVIKLGVKILLIRNNNTQQEGCSRSINNNKKNTRMSFSVAYWPKKMLAFMLSWMY